MALTTTRVSIIHLKYLLHFLLNHPGSNTAINNTLDKNWHKGHVVLTNRFSLFLVPLQNFLNSCSISLGSFLTSSDKEAENLSTVFIQTKKQVVSVKVGSVFYFSQLPSHSPAFKLFIATTEANITNRHTCNSILSLKNCYKLQKTYTSEVSLLYVSSKDADVSRWILHDKSSISRRFFIHKSTQKHQKLLAIRLTVATRWLSLKTVFLSALLSCRFMIEPRSRIIRPIRSVAGHLNKKCQVYAY